MRRSRRPSPLAPFVLAAVLVAAAPASAQSYAVGAGGGVVNDTGSAEDLNSFGTGGGFVYGEVVLDEGVLLQGRYSWFTLPAAVSGSPNLAVDAGTLTVGYLFKSDWWSGGFVLGGGGYHARPKSPEEGQVVAEKDETVFGWTGGLLTVFQLSRRFDLRLEAMGHLIRNETSRKPVIVSVSASYRF